MTDLSWDIGRVEIALTAKLRQTTEAASRGLALAAEHILTTANKHVPHEEGTLERSGATDVAGLEASIYYDTPYAARQHEELDYQHDEGRNAKWLENAMNSEASAAADIIARTIRGEL